MSVESVLQAVKNDVVGFAEDVAADWKKVKAAWKIISSPAVRSVFLTLGQKVIQTIADGVEEFKTGGLSITLDEKLVTDIKDLIAEAKAGEGVIASDLKAIGVILKSPAAPIPAPSVVNIPAQVAAQAAQTGAVVGK
jgi:hypothetical protein